MQTDIQIIPAILATTEEEYREKLKRIETSPELADGWVQIDIMDGKFVPNKSVGLDVIRKYPTLLKKEAHLMVNNPASWVEELINLDFEKIVVHIEVGEKKLHAALSIINKHKKTGVLAFNPETSIKEYKHYESLVYGVLLMSVRPGFGGQELLLSSIDKVKELREHIPPHYFIEVDGGINENSAKLLLEAGANYLVTGNHLINGDITENLEKIWESIRS